MSVHYEKEIRIYARSEREIDAVIAAFAEEFPKLEGAETIGVAYANSLWSKMPTKNGGTPNGDRIISNGREVHCAIFGAFERYPIIMAMTGVVLEVLKKFPEVGATTFESDHQGDDAEPYGILLQNKFESAASRDVAGNSILTLAAWLAGEDENTASQD